MRFVCASLIARRLGLVVFEILGAVAYCFPNRERTRTLEHLRFIFSGQWPERKILFLGEAGLSGARKKCI